MKFKLDENLGTRTTQIFLHAGHAVETVRQESLQGASDTDLYAVCCAEQRCLITLDLDFSNVTRFPPEKSGGIVVIRAPRNPSLALLEELVRQFLKAAEQLTAEKRLWIVETGRIRVHQSEEDEN